MLKERIITALLLIAALLTVLFFASRDVGVVLFGILLLVAAWEWSGLAEIRGGVPRAAYTLAMALVIGWLAWWMPTGHMPQGLLWAHLALWGVVALLLTRFPLRLPWAVVLAGGLVLLPLAWLAFAWLLKTRGLGPQWVLYMFVVVAAADVGAYFAGRSLGRVKLAPQISPKKTWEGLIGGLCLVALVATGAAHWFGVPALPLVALSLAAAGVSVVGDLGISMLKRTAGLKDTGQVFPGHGGVLDRIDSLLAAIPVFVLGVRWLVPA
jgi:phosphatidate cytidylyltransferase